MMGAGIYLHIPYCVRRCYYCDFVSSSNRTDIFKYAKALCEEMPMRPYAGKITSVFFGGGTPSRMPGGCVQLLMDALRAQYDIAEDAEITLEANPGNVDEGKLRGYWDSGVNRLSFGVQSAQSRLLRSIGRIHTWEDAASSVALSRIVGFENVNMDVLYGLPEQSVQDFAATIDAALSLQVQHISAYSLILEEGTPLYAQRGGLHFPSEEEIDEMQEIAIERMGQAGLARYEISNYALPGFECRHNMLYWENGEYIGLGCGAHGRVGRVRYENVTDIDEYFSRMAQGALPQAAQREVSAREDTFDSIMLGTRMLRGVDIAAFAKRFGEPPEALFGEALPKLVQEGLMEEKGGFLRLTKAGLDLQNQVLLRLMD